MKPLLSTLLCSGLVACSFSIMASDFRPHLSIKRGAHQIKLQESYGGPLFNGSFHVTSFGVGAEIGDNLLFEVWHGGSRELSKLKPIGAEGSLPGCDTCIGQDGACVVSTKAKHASTDVSFIYFTDKIYDTRFLIGGGVSRVKLKASHQLHSDTLTGSPSMRSINMSARTYNLKQFVPRAMIGVEHFINENVSIKAEHEFKKTHGKSSKSNERADGKAKISMRNTNVFHMGFSYKF